MTLAALGTGRFRLWRFYLNACVDSFRHGHLPVVQALLATPDEARQVDLLRSRADLYRSG